MLRWLHRYLDKRYGSEPSIGVISPKEWAGLLSELADGYDRHAPVFRAIQIHLRNTERQAFRIPPIKTAADLELWKVEQYGLVREANAIRFLMRLPIEGAKLRARAHAEKERKANEPEPEDSADLD